MTTQHISQEKLKSINIIDELTTYQQKWKGMPTVLFEKLSCFLVKFFNLEVKETWYYQDADGKTKNN